MLTPAELVSALEGLGLRATERMLTDWREKSLLPELQRVGLGQGLGTKSGWTGPEVRTQAIAASLLFKRVTYSDRVLLGLWFCGFDIPHEKAKAAWFETLKHRRARIERFAAKQPGGVEGLFSKWAGQLHRKSFVAAEKGHAENLRDLIVEFLTAVYGAHEDFDGWALSELIENVIPNRLGISKDYLATWMQQAHKFVVENISIEAVANTAETASVEELLAAHTTLKLVRETVLTFIARSDTLSELERILMVSAFMNDLGNLLCVAHIHASRLNMGTYLALSLPLLQRFLTGIEAGGITQKENGLLALSPATARKFVKLRADIREIWNF